MAGNDMLLTEASVYAAAARGEPPSAFLVSPTNVLMSALVSAVANTHETAVLTLLKAGAEPTVSVGDRLLNRPLAVRTSLEARPETLAAWVNAVDGCKLPGELPPGSFIALFEAGWRAERFLPEETARQFDRWDPIERTIAGLGPELVASLSAFAREVGADQTADSLDAHLARARPQTRLTSRLGPRP